ncbi:MAG TPA: flagellar basal body P-ring formation chaperone FlgA [Rhodanobacteraceae bacterium]|nr:flagellar basal body P-ring formation chaperone FlgA [Rhodanobacteraceae bacterium]
MAIPLRRAADFWRLVPPAALACAPAAGLATPIAVQPLQALRVFAVQTVRAGTPPDATLVANADRLDPRLRLPACRGPLRAETPNLLAATSVVMVPVTCTAGADWTVRVPVAIQLFRKVLVATQAIGRGSELQPGEFTAVSRNVATLGYGYLVDAGRLAGRRIRMAIVAGTVITPSMLAPEHTIRSGQTVSIVAHVGTVEVRADGVALAGGGPGDVIRVKSTGCDCLVQGTIQPDDTVAAVP